MVHLPDKKTKNNKYHSKGKAEDNINRKNQEVASKKSTVLKSYIRVSDKKNYRPFPKK